MHIFLISAMSILLSFVYNRNFTIPNPGRAGLEIRARTLAHARIYIMYIIIIIITESYVESLARGGTRGVWGCGNYGNLRNLEKRTLA